MSSSSPSPMSTQEPWDLVAVGYVAENLPSFEAFAREALRLSPARGEVVDVAAGPGSLSLLAAGTATRVHAVDFAPAMLSQLHERAERAGIANITTYTADGQALPFADHSFDAAYSMFGLIFFPDRARGLLELLRVLRPGARALVSSWPPFDRVPSFAALFGAINAELPSPSGGAPPALATAEELHAEMGAAGFRDIEVHEHSVSLGLVAPTELWRSFAKGGAPAVWLRKRMGDEPFRAFSERVVARMNETHGPDAREMKLIALLGIGTR